MTEARGADAAGGEGGFVRITRLRFDPARRGRLEELWRTVSVPHAMGRPGFRRIRACLALDEPGVAFIVSEWEDRESADAYLGDASHGELAELYAREVEGRTEKWACRWL